MDINDHQWAIIDLCTNIHALHVHFKGKRNVHHSINLISPPDQSHTHTPVLGNSNTASVLAGLLVHPHTLRTATVYGTHCPPCGNRRCGVVCLVGGVNPIEK